MAKPPARSPPPAATVDAEHNDDERGHPKESAAERKRGVLRQRQHIKDQTGEDPLRGGIAD
jgi:hypothetical protein